MKEREGLSAKFRLGDRSVDYPPTFKLRWESAGSCLVRSHKEYITYYNFEAVIVKFQFPHILRPVADLGGKIEKCNLKKNH